MTPERINIRIANLNGYRVIESGENRIWLLCRHDKVIWKFPFVSGEVPKLGDVIKMIPNYHGDLNAAREMEEHLRPNYNNIGSDWSEWDAYVKELDNTVGSEDVAHADASVKAKVFCRIVICPLCGKTIWDCEQTTCKGGI